MSALEQYGLLLGDDNRCLPGNAARTVDDLWDAIAQAIEAFKPEECQNYFAAPRYDQD